MIVCRTHAAVGARRDRLGRSCRSCSLSSGRCGLCCSCGSGGCTRRSWPEAWTATLQNSESVCLGRSSLSLLLQHAAEGPVVRCKLADCILKPCDLCSVRGHASVTPQRVEGGVAHGTCLDAVTSSRDTRCRFAAARPSCCRRWPVTCRCDRARSAASILRAGLCGDKGRRRGVSSGMHGYTLVQEQRSVFAHLYTSAIETTN